MLRLKLAGKIVATLTVLTLLYASSPGVAGPQDKPKGQQRNVETIKEQAKAAPTPPPPSEAEKRAAQIAKMIAEYDLKPHPLPSIPDDPPPHEGAMIALPHIVEPPDLVLVEVLETLPGRPISGERLVRPDGKISIGFYGDVYVKGLTIEQIKVAIIKHLQKYLADEILGLERPEDDIEIEVDRPNVPSAFRNPFEPDDPEAKPKPDRQNAPVTKPGRADQMPEERRGPFEVVVEAGKWTIVPPAQSDRVFVDITAYNSKTYFILGDVMVPGKLPWTGNETVLDALQFAGGLLSTGEPKDIRLVRPGRGGKPAKVYKIDLAAIQEKGDITANYQILPGDRLIVGRNEVVKKTVEIDRLNAPIQSVLGYMLQEAFVLRYLQFTTTENREELLKELVDFWSKELSRPGGIKFDEQTLRDALIRKMKLTPPRLETTPAPR